MPSSVTLRSGQKVECVSYTPGLGAALFCMMAVVLLGYFILFRLVAPEAENLSWAGKLLCGLKLSSFKPQWMASFLGNRKLYWVMDFAPLVLLAALSVGLVVRLFFAVFFTPPDTSLLYDPLFKLRHDGIPSPALNHLEDLLKVCPQYERNRLMVDFFLAGTTLEAPASRIINMKDEPSKRQIQDAQES